MESIFFLLFALAIGVGLFSQARRVRLWGAVARDFGLQYTRANLFASPRISGVVDGVMADVRLLNQNKTSYVQIVVEYSPAPTEFRITRATEIGNALRASVLGQLVETISGEDVEIGHDAFDELARIDGDPRELATYLTVERRNAITYLLENFPGTRVTEDEIRIRLHARDSSGEHLRHGLSQTIAAGRLMASTDRSPQPPDEAPEPESRESAIAGTDPYDPWTGAQDIPPPPPAPDRRRTVPGSMNAPADPVIFGQVDAEVMADDLFASGAVSYEAERRFREHYKGLVVSWRGHLVKSRPGSTIVKVGEIDDPLFGRSSITVVSDAEVRADLRTGDLVMLNGVARSINHLERTIYLDNAVVSR